MGHDLPFTPFGPYQSFIDHVLVVVGPNLTLQSMVLITRDEALQVLGEMLYQDSEAPHSRMNDRAVLIYQLGNGFIRRSGNFLNIARQVVNGLESLEEGLAHVEADPQFQNLLVQVKFLSGRINYTDQERPILDQWLRDTRAVANLYDFLINRILAHRANTRENFEGSVLHELMTRERGTNDP